MRSSIDSRVFSLFGASLALLLAVAPALAQNASVSAGGKAFPNISGGSTFINAPPLVATYFEQNGENVGFGEGRPGTLVAHAKIVNGPEPFSQSTGTAGFTEYIQHNHSALPENGTGTFSHRFTLTGTLKVKAEGHGNAAISITARGPNFQDELTGFLEMGKSSPGAVLFATTGGTHPFNNIFANEDGSMRIWGTSSSAVDGYYTIRVRIPVSFTFTSVRYNAVGGGYGFFNAVSIDLGAYAFANAEADLRGTFEYTEQNPIVPDFASGNLPASGWTYEALSGDITLPEPLSVPTATGTGDAAFSTEQGTIENLVALDETMLPELPPVGGEFPHGFFSFDVTSLETGAVADLSAVMPLDLAGSTRWWFHTPADGWAMLPAAVTDGTGHMILAGTDNAAEDLEAADGILRLLGGPGLIEVIFSHGFED